MQVNAANGTSSVFGTFSASGSPQLALVGHGAAALAMPG